MPRTGEIDVSDVSDASDTIDAIDALLPQTQCGQCGYAGCRPYARALAAGAAHINRCPPGGDDVINDLARLLNVAVKPLDTSCGMPKPPALAFIDEAWCIGCTLCIQACPVDAIAGAAKLMHTVIAAECTGCELCIAPCPVDCIQMVADERAQDREARLARANHWRARHQARQSRLGVAGAPPATPPAQAPTATGPKQAAIARALARAQARITKKQKSQ